MKRLIAVVISIGLGLPGCATARQPMAQSARPGAVMPRVDSVDQAIDRYIRSLPVGVRVKVVEHEGRRYSAALLGVEGDRVVLQRATRVPEPPRRVPMGAIASLTRDEGGGMSAAKALVIGVSAGAAAFFSLMLAAFALIGD
jgi:hypothetical protein